MHRQKGEHPSSIIEWQRIIPRAIQRGVFIRDDCARADASKLKNERTMPRGLKDDETADCSELQSQNQDAQTFKTDASNRNWN